MNMSDALIGHTGFVGGHLAAQHRFDACFNSKNIESIRGRRFNTLVISGMPAAKWIANGDAVGDRANLDRLWDSINTCEADRVVIASTVDVYPAPLGADEDTIIEPIFQQPYGRHRLELERRAASRFSRVLALRLPGLYGPGLKKNAIYDLLHNNRIDAIHPDGKYQFYNLNRLWNDIETALASNLQVANLATEPVSMREVALRAFGCQLAQRPGGIAPHYDVRTKHAALFDGRDGYLETKEQVLNGIASFVTAQRMAPRAAA
jgi:hypothetical protein